MRNTLYLLSANANYERATAGVAIIGANVIRGQTTYDSVFSICMSVGSVG